MVSHRLVVRAGGRVFPVAHRGQTASCCLQALSSSAHWRSCRSAARHKLFNCLPSTIMFIKKASPQANRSVFDTWNHLLIVLAPIALHAIRTPPLWIAARFRLQRRRVVSGCQLSTCTSWICQNNRRMRDYFGPREGFRLGSRLGSSSSTFQFNLFHRKTRSGTGSSPRASPSVSFSVCLSFFFLTCLALCVLM